MTDAITKFRGEYRWLSNFQKVEITHLDLDFGTTEAAYQAAKRMDDPLFRLTVSDFTEPRDAMEYARRFPITTPHWHESAKFAVMYELTLQKFTRHDDLRQKLIDTGDAHLEEGNNWGDRVWGTVNGKGQNNLGRILMEVRKMLSLIDVITTTKPAWNGDEVLEGQRYRKLLGI